MGIFKNASFDEHRRWSYTVPVVCYVILIVMILVLKLPLKPSLKPHIESIDLFAIRLKNSNFNSDQAASRSDGDWQKEYFVNDKNGRFTNIQILSEVFALADTNRDQRLDVRELSAWIRKKIFQHVTEAVGNNQALFNQIDINPQDGVISWAEYHKYFMIHRGFSAAFADNHDEKRHRGVPRRIKESIKKDQAAWSQLAKLEPFSMNADEFLAFTHPESSVAHHLELVEEMYEKFDKDGDELLTEDEFSIFHPEGNDDESLAIRQDEESRRKTFRTLIDRNQDGKANRQELLHYVAPESPRHADQEAEALLGLADVDHDNRLSLDEVLNHPNLFLKSKMIDAARGFHDEF
ncbi:45 kDa calcium-binding protein [Dendroctonus ponderosae]